MGTEQSSARVPDGGNAKKTCFYDLLNVDQNASSNDIKKAYRLKALELHPDRNYGDVERTTALFSEVQTAYEVLSDAHERAWYDSHRDSILRGDSHGENQYEGSVRVTTVNDIANLMSRFAASVPSTNGPNDLFSVVQKFFAELALEEALACDRGDLDRNTYPTFGEASDSYELNVKNFYAAWNGFSTRKTFAWKDAYNYAEAPDRRVRRLMEKENKRLRDEAVREFNDAVRVLVKFVKKRDPRCPQQQSDVDRLKALKEAAAAQATKSRAINEAFIRKQSLPLWDQPSCGNGDGEGDLFPDSETSEIEEVIECVTCSKSFKSEKQYASHEKSKKHIKAAEQLRRQMRKDDMSISHGETRRNSGRPQADTQDLSYGDETFSEITADVPVSSANPTQTSLDCVDPHTAPTSLLYGAAGMSSENEDTSLGSLQVNSLASGDPEEDLLLTDNTTPADLVGHIPSPVSLQAPCCISGSQGEHLSAAEFATISRTKDADETVDVFPPAKKIGKAKAKRAKKAVQQDFVDQAAIFCMSCGSTFPSKSKLFRHIKDEGHAQPAGISRIS